MLLCVAKCRSSGAPSHASPPRVLTLVALVAAAASVAARAQRPDSGTTSTAAYRAAAARMQPGDRIVLRVWREPTLNDTVNVDQNDQAVFPRLGVLSLASQTIGALPDTLRARYAEYLRNPSIDVTVLRRIGVLGEVRNPDLYWVDVTMTLPNMIAKAGGITWVGNANDVRLVRDGNAVKIRDWEKAGTLASDLLSGDEIIVGRSSWLSLNALTVVSAAGVLFSIAFTLFKL